MSLVRSVLEGVVRGRKRLKWVSAFGTSGAKQQSASVHSQHPHSNRQTKTQVVPHGGVQGFF